MQREYVGIDLYRLRSVIHRMTTPATSSTASESRRTRCASPRKCRGGAGERRYRRSHLRLGASGSGT
jgi:hypothetical protein